MGLIQRVKCSRCDRSYSGLKNRCPYCGASRGRGGKRVADATDATARRMIKVLLLLVLVVTVISAIIINLGSEAEGELLNNGPEIIGDGQAPDLDDEEADDVPATPAPTPPPTPAPTPTPIPVTSLGIAWAFQQGNVNEMTLRVGDSLAVWAEIFPTDADIDEIRWETGNNTVATVRVDAEDFQRIELMAVGVGTTTITVTLGGHTSDLIVRVTA